MKDKRVLLIGAAGLLGVEVRKRFEEAGASLILGSRSSEQCPIDIRDEQSVQRVFAENTVDAVVNCAAYTDVDAAESDYLEAFSVNAAGVANLAKLCAQNAIHLTHISTDYVFGNSPGVEPYREDASAAPLSIYGLSKWYGEQFLAALAPKQSLLIRTSWLHGMAGKNFISTMLELGASKPELRVVDDQRGSLTWAPWLAACILDLVSRQATGTFHVASSGVASWYEVTCELFAQAGLDTPVHPVTTEEFPRAAPRPAFSALNTDKLHRVCSLPEFSWKDSIRAHLQALGCSEGKET